MAEVLVATTWECNLRCSYCFVQQHRRALVRAPMTPATSAQLVDVLDAGLDHVETICIHLYGGEPLTNLPAIEAMLSRAACKPPGRFRFSITTNGTIVSERAIDLLQAGRFQVVLSIDGPAEIHDRNRRTLSGAPTHATVLRFLEALRSRTDCEVRGSAVVSAGWSLSQATAYLRSLPVEHIKAQAVRGRPVSGHALGPVQRQAYLEDLEAIGRQVIIELENGQEPRDDRFSSRVLQLLTGQERTSFCGAGRTIFGVAPDGTVLPCVLIDGQEDRLGHISDGRGTWVEAGRRWIASRPARPECQLCAALALCGGGCPAMLPICGEDECALVRKNCEVATGIFQRFREHPEMLLALAGIT